VCLQVVRFASVAPLPTLTSGNPFCGTCKLVCGHAGVCRYPAIKSAPTSIYLQISTFRISGLALCGQSSGIPFKSVRRPAILVWRQGNHSEPLDRPHWPDRYRHESRFRFVRSVCHPVPCRPPRSERARVAFDRQVLRRGRIGYSDRATGAARYSSVRPRLRFAACARPAVPLRLAVPQSRLAATRGQPPDPKRPGGWPFFSCAYLNSSLTFFAKIPLYFLHCSRQVLLYPFAYRATIYVRLRIVQLDSCD